MTINWDLVWASLGPLLFGAIAGTIPLALASFALGLAPGPGRRADAAQPQRRVSRPSARIYISVIRGTPLLVQLFVIFYGLPSIGITIGPWPSAIIAFSLNVGGYAAEVIRAAILSVPQGPVGGRPHDRHVPAPDTAADHPAAGRAGLGPAAVQHLHQPGQGHLAGFADPGDRDVPPGPADRGLQPGVHAAVSRGGRRSIGSSASSWPPGSPPSRRDWTAMSPTEPAIPTGRRRAADGARGLRKAFGQHEVLRSIDLTSAAAKCSP